MKRQDINIRDPFILADGNEFFLYGSTDKNVWAGKCESFEMYRSSDLENFDAPVKVFVKTDEFWADENFWAPEVHKYNGRYYMFASFFTNGRRRASQILTAESPYGPFLPFDNVLTPPEWDCLDATLYVEDGKPYAVFCHEWTQIRDGEICRVPLSDDLRTPLAAPEKIFSASAAPWVKGFATEKCDDNYITDGPFFHKLKSGKLLMLWSSNGNDGYAVGMAVSDSGSVCGEFRHIADPLFRNDGGHAMLFKVGDRLILTLHQPNMPSGSERPVFFECEECDDRIRIVKPI